MRANTRQLGVVVQCAVALVVLLLGGTNAFAQEKAGGDGIMVHGHWTIDVKNPDGSLVSHNEFENALTADGAAAMSQVLGHADSSVGWAIQFNTALGPFYIVEPALAVAGSPFAGTHTSANLIVTAPTSGPGYGQLVLAGSTQAPGAYSIPAVGTWLATSSTGSFQGPFQFTNRILAQAISILANQIVQVTVVLSFS